MHQSPKDEYLVLYNGTSPVLRVVHLYEPKRDHDVIDLRHFVKQDEAYANRLECVVAWIERNSFVVLMSNGKMVVSKKFEVGEQVKEVDLDADLLGFNGKISSVASLGWGYLADLSKGMYLAMEIFPLSPFFCCQESRLDSEPTLCACVCVCVCVCLLRKNFF